MKKIISLLFLLCFIPACSGNNLTFEQSQQDSKLKMQMLRDARFKGSVYYESGGSLLSAGQKTTFFLGPENQTFRFSGEVDYTQLPTQLPAGQPGPVIENPQPPK